MTEKNIGKELENLRKKAGFTRVELAEKLFTTETSIYRWENNLRTPSKLTVEAFKRKCM